METGKEVNKQPKTYTYPQTTVLRTASSPGSNLDRHGGSILNRRQQPRLSDHEPGRANGRSVLAAALHYSVACLQAETRRYARIPREDSKQSTAPAMGLGSRYRSPGGRGTSRVAIVGLRMRVTAAQIAASSLEVRKSARAVVMSAMRCLRAALNIARCGGGYRSMTSCIAPSRTRSRPLKRPTSPTSSSMAVAAVTGGFSGSWGCIDELCARMQVDSPQKRATILLNLGWFKQLRNRPGQLRQSRLPRWAITSAAFRVARCDGGGAS